MCSGRPLWLPLSGLRLSSPSSARWKADRHPFPARDILCIHHQLGGRIASKEDLVGFVAQALGCG